MRDTMAVGFPRPDWVMCGVQNPAGGVRLIASKELSQAQLEAEIRTDYVMNSYSPFIDPASITARYTLTAEMRTYIIIDAPDYPAAFRSLFDGWSPEPDARTGIESQRAITP